jgi:hypothetical protein
MTRRPIRPITEPGVQVKIRKRNSDALGETIVLAMTAAVIYPWFYLYRKVRSYF